jgi:hypothetical protein
MVSDTFVYGLGALAAGEVTGVTNVTPLGAGSDGSEPAQGGGGVIGDLPPGLIGGVGNSATQGVQNAISALAGAGAFSGGGGGGTTVIRDAQEAVETAGETVRSGTQVIERVVPVDGGGDTQTVPTQEQTNSGRPWRYSADSPGGTDYTLTESDNGIVRTLGAGGKALRDTVTGAGEFGTGFAEENPIFVGGATAGATAGSVVPGAGTAAGAAVGGLAGATAEIATDTLTGGTPLGVQSPVDVTEWFSGGNGGSSGDGSGASGDAQRGTRGYQDQSDRTTTGDGSQPDTNGSDNPGRGERTRTVTVPSASQDQTNDRDTASGRSFGSINRTGVSEEQEPETAQNTYGYTTY